LKTDELRRRRRRKYLSPLIHIGKQFIAYVVALLKSEGWRSLKLAEPRKRRIPPCGRRRSSSSWCEVELVHGIWTCPTCGCFVPGKFRGDD
jgi:hypothetical protein